MLKYLIPLLFLFISPIAQADELEAISKRLQEIGKKDDKWRRGFELHQLEIELNKEIENGRRQRAGVSEVTIKKNYPVVPYDPNHPNVQKEKKSKFNISAKAKTLAGRFGRGLNALALGTAVAELVGEGIDWVLDPENNRVKFKKPLDGYIFKGFHSEFESPDVDQVTEVECKISNGGGKYEGSDYPMRGDPRTDSFVYTACNNGWAHIWVIKTKDDSLSLDKIAQHVINNENNTTNNYTTNIYYGAVTDTLTEQIAKGEHDTDIKNAVDKLADDKTDSDTDTGTSTDNKDEPDGKTETETGGGGGRLEFPKFCEWAKPVCDFIEWFQDKPPKPEKPQNVPKADLSDLGIDDERFQSHVDFGGSCPTGNLQFEVMGRVYSKPIPYHHFCNLLILLKPWLLAFSYLISAFFVVENL